MDDSKCSISVVCPPDPRTTRVLTGRLRFCLKVEVVDPLFLLFDFICCRTVKIRIMSIVMTMLMPHIICVGVIDIVY